MEYPGNSLWMKVLAINFCLQHFSFHLRTFQFSMCSNSVPSREWPGSSHETSLRNHLKRESELNFITRNKIYGCSNPELDINFVVGVV